MATDKILLNQAFRILRKQGFFAQQAFWCCQTCGWSAVPEGVKDVAFYHKQDAASIKHGMIDKGGVYIAWQGSAQKIVDAMQNVGLKVAWSGSEDKRIRVFSQIEKQIKE